MSITSFRTTYMSNRTEDVANKGKMAELVVKFMDFDMNINPPRFRAQTNRQTFGFGPPLITVLFLAYKKRQKH